MYKGVLDRLAVCIKHVRASVENIQEKKKVQFLRPASPVHDHLPTWQYFCKEAVMWKYLDHPNVLPLLGITIDPLQLVSKWVSGGNLQQYIKKHPTADRRKLVCVPLVITVLPITLLSAVRHC